MDIRRLHYFVTLVQEKHYSNAAIKLHISQPSLSNAIKKLEEEVGFQLLERDTRNLELTEPGRLFYIRALELIGRFSNLHTELEEIKQLGSGTISIGLIESANYWLPKIIRNFKSSYSDIRFQFKEILGEKNVIEALEKYSVHFMVTNQHINNEKMNVTPIYTEKFLLLTHKDDELARKRDVSVHDLAGKKLIISTPGYQTREDILRAFKKAAIPPNIVFEIERLETACRLAEEGLGITILPESYIMYATGRNTDCRPIDFPGLERTVYVAYLKNRYLSPAVFKLIDEIISFFKNKEMASGC